ncbi:CRISPR-associated endonuclease/helicase Cas3 [Prosthecobacter debontii]|uniref:CRISPR-associated endonuclease/helicase Cas3 n=2 Tax=Prosthecobacter debontii TaxID=48467 RepID=A0A1T4YL77_9BACT|nr:CRISPR-associated endonuclease/helicase Cas3 [Prosthecobacter debontii]
MPETFSTFFSRASGVDRQRYDYQECLASLPCESRLISVPTGLGKTAAVILAWLWNRVHNKNPSWPRRLVYCLPMRTLVEQTRDEAQKWLTNLGLTGQVGLHILMGGEDTEDWDLYPEKDAILIGTQDMLLSRALNRGYGMSRYRWPMHFGLLNNDCLWVLDETQLMGPGLSTACQLEAFRKNDDGFFGSFPGGQSITWYASATGNAEHLQTREWRGIAREEDFFFDLKEEKDATSGPVAERLGATKSIKLEPSKNFGSKGEKPDAQLIQTILQKHREMVETLQQAPSAIPRRSLIICNTVDRASKVYTAIKSVLGESHKEDLLLMHSRFRPNERREQVLRLNAEHLAQCPAGQIVVATQVIEAGVDLSSDLLWTEIAPLASIVQRLGRLNRGGEFGFGNTAKHGFTPQATVVGIDAPNPRDGTKRNAKESAEAIGKATTAYLPYSWEKALDAFDALKLLKADASPRNIEKIQSQVQASIERCPYSLQRHELLDFFDTDSNLSLGFTDVSPFVRGTDADTDFQVLWRNRLGSDEEWDGSEPDSNYRPDFQRQELCSVSISKIKEARAILNQGWVWRGKESGWISVRDSDVYPGMTILLPCKAGGYSVEDGWTGVFNKDKPISDLYEPRASLSDEDMLSSLENGWQSIAEHTLEVQAAFEAILRKLPEDFLSSEERQACERGIRWHDVGKNHPAWKTAALEALTDAKIDTTGKPHPLAKFSLSNSPDLVYPDGKPKFTGRELKREINRLRRSFKPGMAHEVASALAFRQAEQKRLGPSRDADILSLLAEYLIMAHHGHVRKVLRDELPKNRTEPKDAETVRGIKDADVLESVEIGSETLGPFTLLTDCRKMGRRDVNGNESYTRGVLRLLERYGPFRLAYFEALFRAADIRASILAKDKPSA